MYLTRHATSHGPRWAADGRFLPDGLGLGIALQLPAESLAAMLAAAAAGPEARGALLPPLEHTHEVWAAGVTYLRSREARMSESDTADIYDKVYDADRAEVFFKTSGWRAMGHQQPIRIRRDSAWNVPEPELVLVINAHGEVVGYTAGNDVSSRAIEGENPLYLPQAKVYDGSCALGPGIVVAPADRQRSLAVRMTITRGSEVMFDGETSTDQLKRSLEEMVGWLGRELSFPDGVLLMTGTCLVPDDSFTLEVGDRTRVAVGDLVLENVVA